MSSHVVDFNARENNFIEEPYNTENYFFENHIEKLSFVTNVLENYFPVLPLTGLTFLNILLVWAGAFLSVAWPTVCFQS